MKKLNLSALLITFVILSIISASCSTQAPLKSEQSGKEKVTLKVGILPYISNTVLQIAQDSGYFAEQNLDIEFVQVKSSSDVVPLLASNEIDIGTPALNAGLFNTIEKGAKFKVVLPLTEAAVKDCSAVAYLARKVDIEAGKYNNKSSWADAKFVLSVNGLTSIPGFVLSKTLAGSGLSVDQINLQNVEIAAQEEALRTGQVDIVYAVEPSVTRFTAKGDIAILDRAENYVPGLAMSVIAIGEKVYTNPDVANRFAVAYIKAVRQYSKGSTDENNINSAAALTKLPPDLVKDICWATISLNGELNVESIQEYQKWMVERGLMDKALDPSQYYDPSYANSAIQIIGKQ
jgi:NitT/TauT family transport system substrate-binding protein